MSLVYVIEDDPTMADVIALSARSTVIFDDKNQETHPDVQVFNDAIEPLSEMNEGLPDVILLDVLLSGPDGFAFLNELISYHDTVKIPVVLISSTDLSKHNLEHYGVFHVLDKGTMTPEDIRDAVLTGLEKGMTAPELGIQKLNQQLSQIEHNLSSPQTIVPQELKVRTSDPGLTSTTPNMHDSDLASIPNSTTPTINQQPEDNAV